jgi:hypothetical protein
MQIGAFALDFRRKRCRGMSRKEALASVDSIPAESKLRDLWLLGTVSSAACESVDD